MSAPVSAWPFVLATVAPLVLVAVAVGVTITLLL